MELSSFCELQPGVVCENTLVDQSRVPFGRTYSTLPSAYSITAHDSPSDGAVEERVLPKNDPCDDVSAAEEPKVEVLP